MNKIQDYTYQNIIFVHDFVFIFLILVFWIILAYFIIVLLEYTIEMHSQYFRDAILPIKKKKKWYKEWYEKW